MSAPTSNDSRIRWQAFKSILMKFSIFLFLFFGIAFVAPYTIKQVKDLPKTNQPQLKLIAYRTEPST